jgi:hypothetical protein
MQMVDGKIVGKIVIFSEVICTLEKATVFLSREDPE